jgi:hypothetical protein
MIIIIIIKKSFNDIHVVKPLDIISMAVFSSSYVLSDLFFSVFGTIVVL